MKKSELKSIIKECVKEVLFEEGVLSNLVAEVAAGITKAQVLMTETTKREENKKIEKQKSELAEKERAKILESKRKMLDAIGNTKMTNIFEGTEALPAQAQGHAAASPLANKDPRDAGIDITGLLAVAGTKWNTLNEGMKK
tara:strand:+ start:13829 stop:14251 length:423 start_codon:yes stop_codon:yes gene_type:complete